MSVINVCAGGGRLTCRKKEGTSGSTELIIKDCGESGGRNKFQTSLIPFYSPLFLSLTLFFFFLLPFITL